MKKAKKVTGGCDIVVDAAPDAPSGTATAVDTGGMRSEALRAGVASDSPLVPPAASAVSGAASERPTGHNLSRRDVVFVFVGLMMAMFVGSLDQTIMSTALSTIVGELGGVDHMQWVTTAYLLCSTVAMPVYGKLGDLYGRKYLFCASSVFFIAGSLVCGAADSMLGLAFGRAVQGIGGGGQIILSQAIVADIFPPRERGKYMGIMGAAFGVSAVLGPLLGGWFTEGLTWRWCFYINIPLGVLAFIAAARFLPHRTHAKHPVRTLDIAGAVTMAIATACLVLAISLGGNSFAWDSPAIIGMFVGAAAFAAVFVAAERRAVNPLIPLSFFRNRNYLICTVVGLCLMTGMMGVLSYIPTYFQIVNGLGAAAAGYMTAPMMIGLMVTSTCAGFIASKTGRVKWLPVASCAVAAVVFALLSTATADTSLAVMGLLLFCLGFGVGLGQQMLVLIVQNEFDLSVAGAVTASNNFFREIGATAGATVVGSLFTSNVVELLASGLAPFGEAAAGIDANSITPAAVHAMEPAIQSAVQSAYNEALTPVFALLVPLMIAGFVLTLLLKEKELAS